MKCACVLEGKPNGQQMTAFTFLRSFWLCRENGERCTSHVWGGRQCECCLWVIIPFVFLMVNHPRRGNIWTSVLGVWVVFRRRETQKSPNEACVDVMMDIHTAAPTTAMSGVRGKIHKHICQQLIGLTHLQRILNYYWFHDLLVRDGGRRICVVGVPETQNLPRFFSFLERLTSSVQCIIQAVPVVGLLFIARGYVGSTAGTALWCGLFC